MGASDLNFPRYRAIRNVVPVAARILFCGWHSVLCSPLLQRERGQSYPLSPIHPSPGISARAGTPAGAIHTKTEGHGAGLQPSLERRMCPSALFSAGWQTSPGFQLCPIQWPGSVTSLKVGFLPSCIPVIHSVPCSRMTQSPIKGSLHVFVKVNVKLQKKSPC